MPIVNVNPTCNPKVTAWAKQHFYRVSNHNDS